MLIVNIFCFTATSTIAQNRASIDQLGLLKSIETEFVYTGDLFANLTDGRAAGLRYMDNFDISIETDLNELAGINNTRLFLYGLGNQGGNLTELTGDAQVVSNIETENSWRLYEAWIQKVVPTLRLSLLFGLYDLNTEFDVLNTASMFLNSSHGIGAEYAASGQSGPSIFPYTSLGLRAKIALMNYLGAEPARYQLRTHNFLVNTRLILELSRQLSGSLPPSPEGIPAGKGDFYLFPTQKVGELNHL